MLAPPPMDPLTTTFLLLTTIAFLSSITRTISFSSNDTLPNCNQTFSCGTIANIGYPFTGGSRPSYCGLPAFQLNCLNDSTTILTSNSLSYIVNQLDQANQTLNLTRSDLYNTTCTTRFDNTSLNSTFFSLSSSSTEMLTLFYECNDSVSAWNGYKPGDRFSCSIDGSVSDAFYLVGPVPNDSIMSMIQCNISTVVPFLRNWLYFIGATNRSVELLGYILRDGFIVNYSDPFSDGCGKCRRSGGQCGFDAEFGNSICICDDRLCTSGKKNNQAPLGIGIGVGGAAIVGIGLGAWALFFVQKRKRKAASMQRKAASMQSKDLPTATPPSSKGSKGLTTPSTNFSLTNSSIPSSTSDLGKGSTYFGVQVFSYNELEKATENFNASKELGEGGFGTVYYGVLHDGRVVAVKRLYENNMRRAEQFMNEVEILARLRHQNLVTLYGCTSRSSQELLLVYEYIPNGTVADHLHGKQSNSGLLTWPIRLSIAIETADALAYLHTSDVIHRDVKTTNILLDNNFRVKVADFGLSRLFPTDVTHVSTAPQGTPGYVDPEYYQCYQLTDKSDVYSFGVVLIELLSSLPAVDTSRHRLDINLANMAVNKIQNHALKDLVDPFLGFETDYAVRRMITSVSELAFRCLQQERDMRPTMAEVLEALKRIENENFGVTKAEVVDIGEDDVGLLKHLPPQLSPDFVVADKWDKMIQSI